jgi:ribose transport system substrate-binding protein
VSNGRSKRARQACVAVGLAALIGTVAACGSSSSSSTSTSSGESTGSSTTANKPVRIAFLNESITSYTKPMMKGMDAQAAQMGAKVDKFSAENDPQKQLTQCQDAIASGKYQALVVYAVDNAAIVPCVKQAKAANIKVVGLDSPIGPDKASAALQTPELSGQVILPLSLDVNTTVKLVKQACAQTGANPCKIVQTVAIPSYSYSAYKLKNEKPLFEKAGFKVVATPVIGNFDDPNGMQNAINNVLTKTKDINVIVADDDSSVQGAVRMKKDGKLPKNVLIVGDGGSAPAVAAIKSGLEYGTVADAPMTEGKKGVEMAVLSVNGKPIPDNNLTEDEINPNLLLTKANASQFTPEW